MITCVLCGGEVRRRWWQRGLLAPLPICRPADVDACRRRAGLPRGVLR